jgi:hypothetical protein
VVGVGVLLVVGGAAVVHELLSIRSQLVSARATLQGALDNPTALQTPAGRSAALAGVDEAVQSVTAARQTARQSKLLIPLRVVPGLRTQWQGLVRLADDSATGVTAGRDLLAKVDTLARQSRLKGGSIPLAEVANLSADVTTTSRTVGGMARSGSGLWWPLGGARRQLNELAGSSADRLGRAAEALGAARTFMGAGGDRRYLVALENNSEMRDQGMVLSYALARFSGGRLSFERSGPIKDVFLTAPTSTALPPGTSDVFGFLAPTRLWQSVNATADFPWSARAMMDMYHQATGDTFDGVIAIDVPGLQGLLQVLGPVQVAGIAQPIAAANAPKVLLHDLYDGLPPGLDQSGRREQLGEVTKAVIARITGADQDPVALGRELGTAATGGHLRLWSAAAAEEDVFERTGLGGAPGAIDADRTFHLAVENRTATKLDYYVKPSVRQDVQLSPQGTAVVRTTVVVDNQAPVGAPPSYQLGPDGFVSSAPGDYLAWLLLWGPAGSMQAAGTQESGLVLSQQVADVVAGQRREVSFETVVPHAVRHGRLELRLVPQARLEPMNLQVGLRAPGWHVDGPKSWTGPWNQVRVFSWKLSR